MDIYNMRKAKCTNCEEGETRTANAIIEATPTILRSTPNRRGDRVSSIAFGKQWGWEVVLSNTSGKIEKIVYTHPHTLTHINTHTQIHDINIENVRYEIPYRYGYTTHTASRAP